MYICLFCLNQYRHSIELIEKLYDLFFAVIFVFIRIADSDLSINAFVIFLIGEIFIDVSLKSSELHRAYQK